jgi:hypothetical protein
MLVALALLAALAAGPLPSAACQVDTEAALKLPPEQFDQDPKGGWRPLGARLPCASAAADLIAAYRKAHWATLTPSELHLNYWHEGQLRATAGETARAVPLLMDGVDPDTSIGFEDYALGTIAFLHHDHAGLEAARARLAALPPPADFAETKARTKARNSLDLVWPLNLNVLDELTACFDRPYSEAYGCRPKPAPAAPF